MERFKDDEFKLDADFGSSFRYRLCIGNYRLLLWAGDTSSCLPRGNSKSISDYTHFEVDLKLDSVAVNPNIFGLPWTEYSKLSLTRGLRQSVDTIRKLIDYLNNKQTITFSTETPSNIKPRQEAPCKQCKNMNDLGAAECWWCGRSNPV